MTHGRLLYLNLAALLAQCLSLLLRSRTLLLLTLNCLLSGSFPLRLLLLTHHLSFVLRTTRLTNPLSFCLDSRTLSCSLVELLFAQLLHLLSRASIAACRLSGQIGHLPFTRLLCRKARLLSRLRGRALIRDLQRLLLHSIIQGLYS